MRKTFTFLILLTTLLLGRQEAHAGAWTQKRGEGYYKLGLRVIRATHFYEPGGNRISIPTTGDYTTSFYSEYGLTDRVTLVVDVPFKRITLNKQVERTSGFVLFDGDAKTGVADSELGVRFGLIRRGRSVLSFELLFGLPIGDDTQQSGLMTGDGEFNQQLKLQFGQSLYPRPFYFSAEIGLNNRTNGFSDEFRYAAEIGYTFWSRFLAIFKVRGVESFKNGADGVSGGMVGLFANNQSYLAFGPEFVYSIDRTFGIVLGVEGATRAENVLSAAAFSVGFFVKR